MNTTELLAVFRDEVADAVLPYLWSDALVYAYIDDAHKQFFRWTFGIEDARSFKLTLTPSVEWYPVDPLVLRIKSASRQATGAPIPVMNIEQVEARCITFSGATGATSALINGMEKGQLRAYPIPNADESGNVIELQTTRLPRNIEPGDDFECDSQHVLNLLAWVKHRAYAKQDAETMDRDKSERFKEEFRMYCVEAKREQHLLTRKVPVVRYRG